MILKSTNKNSKYKHFYILKLHKFKQPTKYFLNHSILTTKYGDLDHKHPINYLNGIKKIICKYQHKQSVIKQREFAKNTFIYQNSIDFSWASVSFKKKGKILLSHHRFLFSPLWLHTKKPTNYEF